MSFIYTIAPHLETLGGELITSLFQTFQMILVYFHFVYYLKIDLR